MQLTPLTRKVGFCVVPNAWEESHVTHVSYLFQMQESTLWNHYSVAHLSDRCDGIPLVAFQTVRGATGMKPREALNFIKNFLHISPTRCNICHKAPRYTAMPLW